MADVIATEIVETKAEIVEVVRDPGIVIEVVRDPIHVIVTEKEEDGHDQETEDDQDLDHVIGIVIVNAIVIGKGEDDRGQEREYENVNEIGIAGIELLTGIAVQIQSFRRHYLKSEFLQ